MTVSGIDISGYQSTTYSTGGLGFVIIKVTEGASYVNPEYEAQLAHARANGMVVGHYHFVRPGSMSSQVNYFLSHANLAAGDLLVLDWEDTGVSGADKDAWLSYATAKQPTHRVLLYCNRDFWLNRDTTSNCGDGLWIADPNSAAGHPNVQHPWIMHQYSEVGGLDHDVANFNTVAALKAWANKTTEETAMALAETDIEKLLKSWISYDAVPAIPAGQPNANSDAATNKTWTVSYTLYAIVVASRQAAAAAKVAVAQTAGLSAAVAALAKDGGITAEQVQAAAEAGAKAALAELGNQLGDLAPGTE